MAEWIKHCSRSNNLGVHLTDDGFQGYKYLWKLLVTGPESLGRAGLGTAAALMPQNWEGWGGGEGSRDGITLQRPLHWNPHPGGPCKHFTPLIQQADLQKDVGGGSHVFQHSGSSREVIFKRSHFVFTHLSIGCYALLGVWSKELLLRPACPPGRWRYPAPYFATPQWLHLPALININPHKSGIYCREAEHWSQLL